MSAQKLGMITNRKFRLILAVVVLIATGAFAFITYEMICVWTTIAALEKVGFADAAAVPRIMNLLDDSNPMIRMKASQALGQIGPQALAAVPALIRSLKDPSAQVRCNAAWALGCVGSGTQVIPPLIEALDDDDPEVRRYSAFALSLLGPLADDAVPKLIERLEDARMGYMAARALGAIGPGAKRSIPHLVTALRGDCSITRMEYAGALGKFGVDAKQAVPDLLELAQDPDPILQKAAEAALLTIGRDGTP
jgi:HEAT repeat protein